MHKLLWLLPIAALGAVLPTAQAQYTRPLIPGVPGAGSPFDPPGRTGPRFGPADAFGRPRVSGPNFGRPALPAPNLPDPWMRAPNKVPPGAFINPPPEVKDRDKLNGLGAIPHLPHFHIPGGEGWGAGEKAAFAPEAVRFGERSSGWAKVAPEAVRFGERSSGWAKVGGGGLLAAVAGLLRALFGRGANKDESRSPDNMFVTAPAAELQGRVIGLGVDGRAGVWVRPRHWGLPSIERPDLPRGRS
jgi:hypothetical protein